MVWEAIVYCSGEAMADGTQSVVAGAYGTACYILADPEVEKVWAKSAASLESPWPTYGELLLPLGSTPKGSTTTQISITSEEPSVGILEPVEHSIFEPKQNQNPVDLALCFSDTFPEVLMSLGNIWWLTFRLQKKRSSIWCTCRYCQSVIDLP